MNEFIEKLIGRLKKLKLTQNPYDSYYEAREFEKTEEINSTNNKTIERIIEIANQLAEEYNNGWIPVDKTLPKKSGYYTVTEEQYSLDMRKKMGVRVSHEVQFDAEEQRWHRAKFLKVIAWKEHETPYQPKGE